MADILCRWRNATPQTVCELVNKLPHKTMRNDEFRLMMDDQFLRTSYQLACQLGLYYVENDVYTPRFVHNIDERQAQVYLEYWIQRYYAPNPYTRSLKGLSTPVFLVKGLVNYIETHGGSVDLKTALKEIYKDPMGNMDILTNALNSYSKVISVNNQGKATLAPNYKEYMETIPNRYDKKAFFDNFSMKESQKKVSHTSSDYSYRQIITAIKTKPFVLLAGISGTGKSRIVRELARSCWDKDSEEYKSQKPRNFEMIQVKPNWHDSTELIGYVSRISGDEKFITGPFLSFLAKAWAEPNVPYFLCLDEMNLAPVEQYFAEYLSVIESRRVHEDGIICTDQIVKFHDEGNDGGWYLALAEELAQNNDDLRLRFKTNTQGITIPQNLIVVGTVNMDETTFSFSRKVLDRAMTIEMNFVDLWGGLDSHYSPIGKLNYEDLIGVAVEGVDVYQTYKTVCDKVLTYLQSINEVLEGTPFKIAYRTRNEFLLYVINNLPYKNDSEGNELPQDYIIARALDEATNMKILPRIEGDDTKVTNDFLNSLSSTIIRCLDEMKGETNEIDNVSIKKLAEMKERLSSGFTSYWS